jgi:hypothetical protein
VKFPTEAIFFLAGKNRDQRASFQMKILSETAKSIKAALPGWQCQLKFRFGKNSF